MKLTKDRVRDAASYLFVNGSGDPYKALLVVDDSGAAHQRTLDQVVEILCVHLGVEP